MAAGMSPRKIAPVLGGSIGGDDGRAALVAADEDLEELLGGVGPELLHAEVFEDEQVDLGERLHERLASAGGLGLERSLERDRRRCGRGRGSRRGWRRRRVAVAMWLLPTPGGPKRSTWSCAATKRAAPSSTSLALGILGLKLPVEVA